MGLYPLTPDYGLHTWFENQGAYDLWTGTDLLLDTARRVLNSDNYIFQGVAFPTGTDINIPPNSSFSGSINLVPYSYVISVTGWSANDNQFTIRLYDKGAVTDVYAKQFAWYPTVVSNMTGSFNEGSPIIQNDKNKPFGPYFFRDPFVVLPPGVLQIQLVNVGNPLPGFTNPQVQLFFNIAVPKTTQSMAIQQVKSSSDPTGTQTLQGIALNNLLGG